MLTCISRLPRLAALIYRNVFKNGDILPAVHDKDMSANFTEMLGTRHTLQGCCHNGQNIGAIRPSVVATARP